MSIPKACWSFTPHYYLSHTGVCRKRRFRARAQEANSYYCLSVMENRKRSAPCFAVLTVR